MPRGIPKNRVSIKQFDELAQKLVTSQSEVIRLTQENTTLKQEVDRLKSNGQSLVPFVKDLTEVHPMTGPMVRLRIGSVVMEIAQEQT